MNNVEKEGVERLLAALLGRRDTAALDYADLLRRGHDLEQFLAVMYDYSRLPPQDRRFIIDEKSGNPDSHTGSSLQVRRASAATR
jgi:hypothetical protein